MKAGKWQEADQETTKLMVKVAVDSRGVQNFPCEILSKVDRLWVDSSGGKFGFSVQKKIYVESCGGKPERQDYAKVEKDWNCFADRVGWSAKGSNRIVDYSNGTFSQAPLGQLPSLATKQWNLWWYVLWGCDL